MNIENKTTGTELAKYLKNKLEVLDINESDFAYYLDKLKVLDGKNNFRDFGGFHIATLEYSMTYTIENFDMNKVGLLSCFLQTWLTENNESNENFTKPEFNFLPLDYENQRSDVSIFIDFKDAIFVIEKEGGEIDFNGKKYGFGKYEVNVAEGFELNGNSN